MSKKLTDKAKKRIVNISMKAGSIVLTLVIAAVLVLNAPIMVLHEANGAEETIEHVSIPSYFKRWQPMIIQEGTISKVESQAVKEELRSEEDVTFDDGLDLNQTIEGQYTILFLGFDTFTNGGGTLHDVNYLIQFNIRTASMNILQIPRDSYMPDYTNSGTNKFNSIYACGDKSVSKVQRVVDAVQESFGIPVDSYVITNCDSIVEIVDIIGGIPINLPRTIVYEPDKILYEGRQVLNGTQSEWFLRFRSGYNEGDIGRVKAQRLFLAAAMKKALDMGNLELMSAMRKIYDRQLMATDLSMEQISMIADLAGTVSMDRVNVFMVPGEEATGPGGQSMWSIHKTAALEIINKWFRPRQVPLAYENSSIIELVPEGSYRNTVNDDTAQNFEDLVN